jgi:hypothetical protein
MDALQQQLQLKFGGGLQGLGQLGDSYDQFKMQQQLQYQQYQYIPYNYIPYNSPKQGFSLANPACKCGAHFRYVVNLLNMNYSWECNSCGWYVDLTELAMQLQTVHPTDLFDHKIGAQAFWVDELGKWIK